MKIAFIAMSGIRVCDAELLELGLTLPGFVERSKAIASLPSLGLLTLAGMTPRRHEIRYIEVDRLDSLEAGAPDPREGDFDLVAISTFTAQMPEALELARSLVARGVQVVIGGLHATSLPDEVVAAGASAVVGEGESVWLEVLRDAECGSLRPVYDARSRPFDLRDAPMPAFELLDIDRYNRITVQTSRGCPWKCSFCASSILLTPAYKQKPIAKVLAEIDAIGELWEHPFIEFADDNSFVNRAYWRELLPEIAKRRIHWFTETDLSIWQHPDLLESLRHAGCAEVLIGFESPVETGLDGIERRRNWKLDKLPQYRRAIRTIQSHGIRVNACFVLGLDGHGPEIFDAVWDFVAEAAPFDVQITYPTPFPGTPLYAEMAAAGRLTHPGDWKRYTLFDVNYEPTPMSAAELRAGFHDLTRRLYSQDFTAWRRDEFHRTALAGRRRRARSAQRESLSARSAMG